jgi:hypothetical protein
MQKSLKYIFGAATLSLAGACVAHAAGPQLHSLLVNLPDGSVEEVQYVGDVAPKVEVAPVRVAADPFLASFDAMSAMMERETQAMLQMASTMAAPAGPGVVMTGAVPKGMHFTYVSTTTDAHGCTRTVSYASDGSGAAPKLTQASSDGCGAVQANPVATPAKAEVPVAPVPRQGQRV